MAVQTWSSEGYVKDARFVIDLGAPVLELLAPKDGEHILDVDCGDGILARKIADLGCNVVGTDTSENFVLSARKLGLAIVQQSAMEMEFEPCSTPCSLTPYFTKLKMPTRRSSGSRARGCRANGSLRTWVSTAV